MNGLKEFGDRIKRLIFERGYATVEQFAHENEIPKGSLSKILNGKVDPKYSTLLKLARALGITPAQLMDAIPAAQAALVMEKNRPNYQTRRKRSR